MTTKYLHNGTLIDGNGGEPLADAALLIEDNRIAAVGPRPQVPRPEAAESIDACGGFILPGLIDTHVHLMLEGIDPGRILTTPFSYNFYAAIDRMQRTIDAGITTVRDAGGADLGLKQAVDDGLVVGPRMQISVQVLSTTGGHGDGWMPSGQRLDLMPTYPGMPDPICDGVEEVRRKVREVLRAGAEVVKVCSTGGVLSATDHPEFTQFTQEELEVMVQEAGFRRGLKVMAHAQGAEGIKNAVRAGIHSIEHGIFLDDEAIELMLEHGTFLVPTLLAPLAVLEQAELTGTMPEYGVRKARETIEIHSESIAKAYAAGVRIAMGTDAGVMPHGTNLRELDLMCRVGLSPMEAIVATTRTAAETLGWEERLGTLEANKLADVVVVKTDPLADIRSLEEASNVVCVMQDGRVLKQKLAGV
jgi:imidazolonepropionase-like amidohydrolase